MENKTEFIVDKLLCMACLCVGRTLHTITAQEMQVFYMDILNEIPLSKNIPHTCPNICWECIAMLRRAVKFREQVKDSYRILQTYTNENLHECLLTDITRTPRLNLHHTDPVSIPPSKEILCGNTDEGHTVQNQCKPMDTVFFKENESVYKDSFQDNELNVVNNAVFVKDEVKCEWDRLSEDPVHNDDAHLSDHSDTLRGIEAEILPRKRKGDKKSLRKGKEIIKRLKIGNKLQTKKSRKKTDAPQKILTIELSYEEMIAEREKDSQRDSYVNAPFKCDSCLVGFAYEKTFRAHHTAKHSANAGNYCCPICKTVVASVDSFTAHYKRHKRRYECSVCKKRTQDAKVMQQHYHSTHEACPRPYRCDLCGKESSTIDTHRYHKDTHKARLQCPECDKTYSHRTGLNHHRVVVHERKQKYPCTLCDKEFGWSTSLKRHLDSHKKNGKRCDAAFCTPCGVGFRSVSGYQKHLRCSLKHVTPQDLPYICDHCNRRYSDKTKLRDHIEEKHLHRTYQCHICNKPSKNRIGLDQHIRNVHIGRPNNKMCHHCGKGFPTKVQLESHIRTHTGERPFICEFCPTTFSQQSNLYKHNRQVHMNIKSKRPPTTKKRKEEDPPPAPAQPPLPPDMYSDQGFLM